MKRSVGLCRGLGIWVVASIIVSAATAGFCGPIHDAARKGDLKKVKALLAADSKIVNDRDNNGDTPLHLAALHNQLPVAQALLDAGADVMRKTLMVHTRRAISGASWDQATTRIRLRC